MRGVLFALALAFAFVASTPCEAAATLISRKFVGVVIDASTNQPIPGARVAAKWSSAHDRGSECVKALSVLSGHDGRFEMPEWVGASIGWGLWAQVTPYKAGYRNSRTVLVHGEARKFLGLFNRNEFELRSEPLRVEMGPFEGSDAGRAAYLAELALSTQCREGSEPFGMNVFYDGIFDEMLQLPPSAQGQQSKGWPGGTVRDVVESLLARTEGAHGRAKPRPYPATPAPPTAIEAKTPK